jgi:hypothetical protein
MGSIVSRIDDIIEEYGSFENYLKGVFPPEYHQIPMKLIPPVKQKPMNFKVIAVPEFDVDVLVRRDVNDVGNPNICIQTFMKDPDGQEYQIEEFIDFDSTTLATRYVTDFSEESAKEFVCVNMRE